MMQAATKSEAPQAYFCDAQTVTEAIKGKRIAIVGSGPGCNENKPGFVDSHDVVIRVNNFKLTHNTGRRTDIYYSFFGTSIKKTAPELERSGVKLCICKCPNEKFINSPWHERRRKFRGVDFRYIYIQRQNWWFCPTYVPTHDEFMAQFDLLGRHIPTTGFAAILEVLKHGPTSVYATGFDFFSSKVHNVNEPWRRRNVTDPIGHDNEAERAWLAANITRLPITVDSRLAQVLGL